MGDGCTHGSRGEATGALLILSGLLAVACGLFLIVLVVQGDQWCTIGAAVVGTVAAILATAAVFYFVELGGVWSPFLATIAMSLILALSGILICDAIAIYM